MRLTKIGTLMLPQNHKFFSVLIFFSCLLGSQISGASQIHIDGHVYLHKEQEKHPQKNQQLLLKIFYGDREIANQKKYTDANGYFSFSNLPSENNYHYLIQSLYQGIEFFSETFHGLEQPEEKNYTTQIDLYPVTKRTNELSIDEQVFYDFSKGSDLVQVTHKLTIENRGAQSYIPSFSDSEKIMITVMEGAFDLSLGEGIHRDEIEIDEEKKQLIFNKRIDPGSKKVSMSFSYRYVASTHSIDLSVPISVHRSQYTVFVNRSRIRIDSRQLGMINDELGMRFVAKDLKQNEVLNYTIKGISLAKDPYFYGLYVFLLCLVLIWIVGWIKLKNQKTSRVQTVPLAWERLDQLRIQYQEGKISQKDFQKESLAIKKLLFERSKIEDVFDKKIGPQT